MLSDVNEVGESNGTPGKGRNNEESDESIQNEENDDGSDSVSEGEEAEYVETYSNRQNQTNAGRGRGRGRGQGRGGTVIHQITPQKRKIKGKTYSSVVARQLQFLLSNVSTLQIQNRTNEEIEILTIIELKKMGNRDIHNLSGEILKVQEEMTKDATATDAQTLILLNEPHINNIVKECSHLDSHSLKCHISNITKKIDKLEEQLRLLKESEKVLNLYLDNVKMSRSALKLLKKCVNKVNYEREEE